MMIISSPMPTFFLSHMHNSAEFSPTFHYRHVHGGFKHDVLALISTITKPGARGHMIIIIDV
jgi:hypothetical protein